MERRKYPSHLGQGRLQVAFAVLEVLFATFRTTHVDNTIHILCYFKSKILESLKLQSNK